MRLIRRRSAREVTAVGPSSGRVVYCWGTPSTSGKLWRREKKEKNKKWRERESERRRVNSGKLAAAVAAASVGDNDVFHQAATQCGCIQRHSILSAPLKGAPVISAGEQQLQNTIKMG